MIKINLLPILCCLLLLVCCKQNPHPGYTFSGGNTYFKLNAFEASQQDKIGPGDIITSTVRVYNSKNEKILDSYHNPSGVIVFCADSADYLFKGKIKELLSNFSKGDSFTVILDTQRVEMRINDVQSPKMYEKLKKQREAFADVHEYLQMKAYLKVNKITTTPIANGLYIIPVTTHPQGKPVTTGSKIEINYQGCFLNGHCFDGLHAFTPFDFTYGNDFQVIKGLEIAIGTMHEGEESKIIIPSHLAYGGKGSSTGVVPPYTTLIYRLKIINVN